jgi:tRNA (guanine-N7-)-methyltransferase
VTIQFPDPWFKRKHQKRRVVQPELIEDLAAALAPGGNVFMQSDVEEVAVEMRDRLAAHPAFTCKHNNWLDSNPLPIPTERETSTMERGEAVYRSMFVLHPRR